MVQKRNDLGITINNTTITLVIAFVMMFASLFFVQVDILLIPLSIIWFFWSTVVIKASVNRNLLKLVVFLFLYVTGLFLFRVCMRNESFINTYVNCVTVFAIIYSSFKTGTYIAKKEHTPSLINAIIFIGVFNSAVNIYSWLTMTGGVVGRYNFYSIINKSVSANVGLSVISAILLLSVSYRNRLLKWGMFAICASNLIIVLTRQKQVLFVVFVLMYVYIVSRNERNIKKSLQRILLLSILIILALIVFSSTFTVIFNQFASLFDEKGIDNIERALSKTDSINMFNESLGFGVGYGYFSSETEYTALATPHGGFLLLMSELGVPGLVCFGILMILLLRHCYYAVFREKNRSLYGSAILLFGCCVTFFPSNTSLLPPANERAYYLECIIYWLLIGVLCETNRRSKEKRLFYDS